MKLWLVDDKNNINSDTIMPDSELEIDCDVNRIDEDTDDKNSVSGDDSFYDVKCRNYRMHDT